PALTGFFRAFALSWFRDSFLFLLRLLEDFLPPVLDLLHGRVRLLGLLGGPLFAAAAAALAAAPFSPVAAPGAAPPPPPPPPVPRPAVGCPAPAPAAPGWRLATRFRPPGPPRLLGMKYTPSPAATL